MLQLKTQHKHNTRTKTFKTQKAQPNPTLIAKSLESLIDTQTGLFFSTLAKVPSTHLIDVLLELSNESLHEVFERLSYQKVYAAMTQIPSDTLTDFLQRTETVNKEYAYKLMTLLKPDERHEFLELSQYSELEAGAYMETEMLTATPDDEIESVKESIRRFRNEEPHSKIIKLFVISESGHLLATLHFSDLMTFEPQQRIDEVMAQLQPHKPLSIHPSSPVEEVIRLFDEYDLSVLAVVDDEGVLKGRILYDDIYELIQRVHTDQVYKLAGVDDEAEEESFASGRQKRLLWLLINLGTILAAAFVIGLFEKTISSYIALAALLPIVAALGGNAGMQAMTVTIRRLTLGEVDFSDIWPVLKRETAIVLINGLVIALAVSTITYIWFDDKMLSLVIALAMFTNLLVTGSVGALIPLVLKRIGIDPAIASSILLTTTSDVFGFFIFLFLAQSILM